MEAGKKKKKDQRVGTAAADGRAEKNSNYLVPGIICFLRECCTRNVAHVFLGRLGSSLWLFAAIFLSPEASKVFMPSP